MEFLVQPGATGATKLLGDCLFLKVWDIYWLPSIKSIVAERDKVK